MPQRPRPSLPWPQYGGPNRDFALPAAPRGDGFSWRRPLGPGTSGIVSDGPSLYTLYSQPKPDSKGSAGDEVVVALDTATGKTRWENKTPVAMRKGQESYTSDPIRPQATPALGDSRLFTLGFTGLLKAFETRTGKVLWERDLVADFDATPVQFGVSASPLLERGALVVHVGGKRHALVAFSPADGKVLWASGPGEPSYATPVAATIDGDAQWVQVTRDAVLGLSAKDGAERWRWPMPRPGLTNVPTPIALPGQRLLVSGQGVNGTRLLQLTRTGATELWKYERTPLFYCNWAVSGGIVYGFAGNAVGALRLADGAELWRERGQSDANFVRVGDETLWLRGDGLLTRSRVTAKGIESGATAPLLKGRCWTPPTIAAATVFARDDQEIVAVPWKSLGGG